MRATASLVLSYFCALHDYVTAVNKRSILLIGRAKNGHVISDANRHCLSAPRAQKGDCHLDSNTASATSVTIQRRETPDKDRVARCSTTLDIRCNSEGGIPPALPPPEIKTPFPPPPPPMPF